MPTVKPPSPVQLLSFMEVNILILKYIDSENSWKFVFPEITTLYRHNRTLTWTVSRLDLNIQSFYLFRKILNVQELEGQ